ncbi:MAG: 30S ribosome-binding factor RbfA [Lachnospiraceae bacterium]|nr:30S ribosome-binding factor RbfA [Lachnospiraceae bacterium]
MRKGTVKYERRNDEVRREISMILATDIKDPRIHPMTSVTSVDVAPDLHNAVVYVSVLGDEREKERTIEGLKSATPRIKHMLAKKMNMRVTPNLSFRIDNSIEYEAEIFDKLREISEKENHDDTDEQED